MRHLLFIVAILYAHSHYAQPLTWSQARQQGWGTLKVYWHVSDPFVYRTTSGNMEGIEVDLMNGFREYVAQKYDVSLQIDWVETESFISLYNYMARNAVEGEFGTAAFSITSERQKYISFSKSYLNDVAVMISHNSIPVMTSIEQFKSVLRNATAITVEGSTYEEKLKSLSKELNTNIDIQIMPSNEPVIANIALNEQSFGYVDLPLYLLALKNDPTVPVIRQNLYPIKGNGYGVTMPQNCSWKPLMDEYISSLYFRHIQDNYIEAYLNKDVYDLIMSITSDESVNADELIILLNKEKEIQSKQLVNDAILLERDRWVRYVLIGVLLSLLMLVMIFYNLYNKKLKAVRQLRLNRDKIEQQQTRIEKANTALLEMDREKNNLIRVLAHDLRSPINQVAGLAEILLISNVALDQESKEIVNQIIKSSMRLRDMIGKILDAEAVNNLTPNIKFEQVDVNEILTSIEQEYGSTARAKHIKLHMSCEENLSIYADPVFFDQILDNLVSNALKFSHANSTVEVIATDHTDGVLIEVKDQGPGFTTDDETRMFQKFQRLSALPTGGEQSTGLGLSIVKMYTELMDGQLTYITKPGLGTTFRLLFPKANASTE